MGNSTWCAKSRFSSGYFLLGAQEAAGAAEVVQVGQDAPLARVAVRDAALLVAVAVEGEPRLLRDLGQLVEHESDVRGVQYEDGVVPPEDADDVEGDDGGVVPGEAGAALDQLALHAGQVLEDLERPVEDVVEVERQPCEVHKEGERLRDGQVVGVGVVEGAEHLDGGLAAAVRDGVLVVVGEAAERLEHLVEAEVARRVLPHLAALRDVDAELLAEELHDVLLEVLGDLHGGLVLATSAFSPGAVIGGAEEHDLPLVAVVDAALVLGLRRRERKVVAELLVPRPLGDVVHRLVLLALPHRRVGVVQLVGVLDLRHELREVAVEVLGVLEGSVVVVLLLGARSVLGRGEEVSAGDELAHVLVVREDVVVDELVEEEDEVGELLLAPGQRGGVVVQVVEQLRLEEHRRRRVEVVRRLVCAF